MRKFITVIICRLSGGAAKTSPPWEEEEASKKHMVKRPGIYHTTPGCVALMCEDGEGVNVVSLDGVASVPKDLVEAVVCFEVDDVNDDAADENAPNRGRCNVEKMKRCIEEKKSEKNIWWLSEVFKFSFYKLRHLASSKLDERPVWFDGKKSDAYVWHVQDKILTRNSCVVWSANEFVGWKPGTVDVWHNKGKTLKGLILSQCALTRKIICRLEEVLGLNELLDSDEHAEVTPDVVMKWLYDAIEGGQSRERYVLYYICGQ